VKGQGLNAKEFKQAYHRGMQQMPLKAREEICNFDQVFREAKGWEDINRGLAEFNCRVQPKGRGGVIVDIHTGEQMKLSRVHRDHSFGRLQKAHGKYAEYAKTIEATKGLKKQIPDKKLRAAFSKFARSKFSSKATQKAAAQGLKQAARGASGLAKTAKSLTSLAASANPVSGAAKMGVGIVKKAMKLTKTQDRGMSR
jgi:hypothetical protein